LVSGASALDRFGAEFLGVKAGELLGKGVYNIPAEEGSVPVYSESWQMLETTSAQAMGFLGLSSLLEERLLPGPAWTINHVGRGEVAFIPFDIFRNFERNRYPMVRMFIGDVTRRLVGELPVRIQAPVCMDVVLRKKEQRILVHLSTVHPVSPMCLTAAPSMTSRRRDR